MITVNVPVNVSSANYVDMALLSQKLAEYAQMLGSKQSESKTEANAKSYRHEILCGIFSEESDWNDLRNEYLRKQIRNMRLFIDTNLFIE